MDAKRFASMVFPAPGGPMRITLCPPDAAISNALLIFSWPFTSAKSFSNACCAALNASCMLMETGAALEPSDWMNATTSLMFFMP